MASFPTTPVVFPTRADATPIFADHMNAVQDEIMALEAALIGGSLPSHSVTAPLTVVGASPVLVLDDTGAVANARAQNLTGDLILSANTSGSSNADDAAKAAVQLALLASSGRLALYTSPAGPVPRTPELVLLVEVNGAIRERGRTAAMGDWVNIPYNAGFFVGGGFAWTVEAADVVTYAYSLVGKTMTITVYVQTTSLAGAANSLQVALPAGYTGAAFAAGSAYLSDNGVVVPAVWRVSPASSVILFGKNHTFNAAFTASTNLTAVAATMSFQVNTP